MYQSIDLAHLKLAEMPKLSGTLWYLSKKQTCRILKENSLRWTEFSPGSLPWVVFEPPPTMQIFSTLIDYLPTSEMAVEGVWNIYFP